MRNDAGLMRAGVLSNARWCALYFRTKLVHVHCHGLTKGDAYVTVFYILCALHQRRIQNVQEEEA